LSAESAARDRTTVHFEQGDERGLAATREWMSEEYRNKGNIIPMLLLDAEDWGALKMSANDLAAGLAASMQGDWELCRLSKKTAFERARGGAGGAHEEGVGAATQQVGRRSGRDCRRGPGNHIQEAAPGLVTGVAQRQRSDQGGCKAIPSGVGRRHHGVVYIRLVTALLELSGLAQLGPFLEKYPGPKLDAKAAGTEERKSLLKLSLESKRCAGSALSVSSRASSSVREDRYSSAQPAMARDKRDFGERGQLSLLIQLDPSSLRWIVGHRESWDGAKAYSKEQNAVVKRVKKEMLSQLRSIIFDKRKQRRWSKYLPIVQRVFNTSVHSATTGCTPVVFPDGETYKRLREESSPQQSLLGIDLLTKR
jgi:hypothetical protein